MPTVTDTTVVNQAYDTSGNGGRKLVRLSNGWLVAVVFDGTNNQFIFYKSTDNGSNWSQLAYLGTTSNLIAIVSKGTIVYGIFGSSGIAIRGFAFDATTVANANIYNTVTVDSGQTDIGNVSIAINQAGTKLLAAWTSKNSTYPYSYNIRTSIGVINTDGTVTWETANQLTTANTSGYDAKNPSVTFIDNTNALVVYESIGSTYTINARKYNGSSWGNSVSVSGNQSYSQSYPSACVAPNGRIWVAWHGKDSTDIDTANIRVSYSDDGGQTWSAMQKLTSGNSFGQAYPSITVNKNNEVFILWHGRYSSIIYNDIRMIKYSSGSWGSISTVSAGTTNHKLYPSALYDTTLDFSTPLFIYQDQQGNKVGFYGTYTVTTISVTPGNLGQKTSSDKSNILSYSITTDGTMSDITEKINGTTIATRTNPTSGQQFTVSLSQAQWDAIKYGNAHTLTISMGSDTWTYTFDKRLNTNDDILSAVKGVQDLQTHLNGIKAQLGAAIRAKGGTVIDTDSWNAFILALSNLQVKKWASGATLTDAGGIITVSGLSFTPSIIELYQYLGDGVTKQFYRFYASQSTTLTYLVSNSTYTTYNTTITANSFTIRGLIPNRNVSWIAFE